RRRRHEQECVDLRHRPVDAPGLTHLAPVKHELLCGWCERHVDSALSGRTVSTEIIRARSAGDKGAAIPASFGSAPAKGHVTFARPHGRGSTMVEALMPAGPSARLSLLRRAS